MSDLHVVFGSGQVGYFLAERLVALGHRVRVVKRTAGGVPANSEVHAGDAADRAFCVTAAAGAVAVYHCMNPPYVTRVWADLVPRYMDNLIEAASCAGARLVVLDNVYMLGRPNGHPLTEDTPMNPCSRKGEIRARVASRLFDAHRRGDVRATTGRASDFYGPRGTLTGLGDFFWPRALAGKTSYSPFSLDAIHTYHYIPDVAAGLATLGTADDDVFGGAWMLPCAPAETLRALVRRMADALGRDIPVAQLPRWIISAAGTFVPIMREMREMLYQWDEPFIVDDRRFRERFGAAPTDVNRAAADTVAWARAHYGA